jgi:cysteine-rich repeat protein
LTALPLADVMGNVRRSARLIGITCAALAGCSFDFDAPFQGGAGAAGGPSSTSSAAGGAGSGAGGSGGGGSAGFCGDGVIDQGEECDDGNDDLGDGCDACTVECDGLGAVEHPVTHHCYVVLPLLRDWFGARDACVAHDPGFSLASLSTLDEVDFIAPYVNSSMWIGANDIADEGTFVWIDGSPWAFPPGTPPWADGQPDNFSEEECVEVRDGGEINDSPCTSNKGVLCERAPAGE